MANGVIRSYTADLYLEYYSRNRRAPGHRLSYRHPDRLDASSYRHPRRYLVRVSVLDGLLLARPTGHSRLGDVTSSQQRAAEPASADNIPISGEGAVQHLFLLGYRLGPLG